MSLVEGVNYSLAVKLLTPAEIEQFIDKGYVVIRNAFPRELADAILPWVQDMESGQGLAVFDPHGDLIDKILGSIPEHRIHDVVLIDPGDETHSVGFNILCAHSDLEKNLLASDLVSVFQRLSTSWGDQMTSVLNNAILAPATWRRSR